MIKRIYEWFYRLFHPKHKIGYCGAVMLETKDGAVCAECGKKLLEIKNLISGLK
jgi:hypothetical protein